MDNLSVTRIDLAKNTFSLHRVNELGAVLLRRTVSLARLTSVVAQLLACLIGLEACFGVHEWPCRFGEFRHTVKLMASKFIGPSRVSPCWARFHVMPG